MTQTTEEQLAILRALRAGEVTAAEAKVALLRARQGAGSRLAPDPATRLADRGVDGRGLVIEGVRSLSEVALAPWGVPEPASGEVTIEVAASAINFPDTMCVQGLYPTIPAYPFVPGFEVAGVVVHVGAGVSDLAAGDEVVALTGDMLGGHASRVNVPAVSAVRKPRNWTFEEACSLPVVFTTVDYAFERAQLRAGEHVLVQTATGGCGLMALQLARLAGCVYSGTSSRPEKLDVLRRLGVAHALDYKRVAFDRELRERTNGRGVDVVLNMLSGDGIQRGLDCLAPGGRYLEIAVHALRATGKLDLGRLIDNQSIHSIDLRRLGAAGRLDVGRSLRKMVSLAEADLVAPIAVHVFPLERIGEALAFVSDAKHIGKVIISHRSGAVEDRTEACLVRLEAQGRAAAERAERPIGEPEPAAKAQRAARPVVARRSNERPIERREPIAVIGVAGRFPKAETLEAFWERLRDGDDCVSEIPPARWGLDGFYDPDPGAPGRSTSKWMGVLEGIDLFDPLFFNISPAEAEAMDPQQRLFLETAWHCIEHAGIDPTSLSGSRCGVFAGCGVGDYGRSAGVDAFHAQGLMGGSPSILAARISYLLNLKGPCLSIDTACSSALVALATACDSLTLGTSDLALAGGVCVLTTPAMHIMTSKSGMLSRDGRCFTFDARANGFVPGEGVAVVLLKRLSDAVRDGDPICGVVRAWGVNQDGKTNGITAPSAASQRDLEIGVWRDFGVDPATITLVEAHGTGTKLGDPIEVDALIQAFAAFPSTHGVPPFCALGSVKSNVGHTMAAAGMAGLVKVLLALEHRTIPPAAHFEALNEHIALDGGPFFVGTSARAWDIAPAGTRRATVNSFGFSGTNAHVVVDERPRERADDSGAGDGEAEVVLLSAKTPERLAAYASLLSSWIAASPDARIVDIAYTLQVGRPALEHRMACVATSKEALVAELERFASGRRAADSVVGRASAADDAVRIFGKDDDARALLRVWSQKRKLRELAELWVRGVEVDWTALAVAGARRIRIPGYPFARERYWFPEPERAASVPTSKLHALLHENTSDVQELRFSSTFTGDEPFLRDHVIGGRRLLPGVAWLEMARAAVERVSGDAGPITIADAVWARPIDVTEGPRRVHVALRKLEGGALGYEFRDDDETEGNYGEGRVSAGVGGARPRHDLEVVRAACRERSWTADACYAAFAKLGLEYGPSCRGLLAVHVGGGNAIAQIAAPASAASGFVLDPTLLDSAVQGAIGLALGESAGESGRPAVPYLLEAAEVFAGCPPTAVAVIRRRPLAAGQPLIKLDVDICDPEGAVCVRLRGLTLRTFGEQADREAQTLLFEPRWAPLVASPSEPPLATAHIVVLGGEFASAQAALAEREPAVKWVPAPPGESLESAFESAALTALDEIRGLTQAGREDAVLLQVAVPAAGSPGALLAVTGLLRSASRENPRIFGQLLAIGGPGDPGNVLRAVRASAAPPWPAEVRDSGGVRELRVWREIDDDRATADAPIWRADDVVLIAGGAGGLGAILSRAMARSAPGVTLALVGSRPLDEARAALVDELLKLGARAVYRRADVTDLEEVSAVVQSLREEFGRVDGVVHAAGVLRDGLLLNKTADAASAVFAPKVRGAVHLDAATCELPIRFFLLFSSIAGAMGNVGQADYAAANAFLDAFAGLRNERVARGERQGRTLSIGWPLWRQGGMRVPEAMERGMRVGRGLVPLESAAGLGALGRAWRSGRDYVLVLNGDAARLREGAESQSRARAPSDKPAPAVASEAGGALYARALERVQQAVAAVAKVPVDRIEPQAPFEKYGIDSILQVTIVRELEKWAGELSKTLLFEHPTARELAEYLASRHAPTLADAAPEPRTEAPAPAQRMRERPRRTRTTQPPSHDADAVAVIGMSGRYPLAPNLDEFWDNLRNGRNCLTPAPLGRFDDRRDGASSNPGLYGGFLDEVDRFDRHVFHVGKDAVAGLTPETRLFLEIAWATLEDGGYTRAALQGLQARSGRGVGVFVGSMYGQYAFTMPTFEAAALASNGTDWGIANRVSHFFDLTGPSVAVNSACSSSLTAIHLACESIRSKSCAMALAGGVNLTLTLSKYDMLRRAKFLGTGSCSRSFGAGDGYLPGEGVGAVLLKPLAAAIADGDRIDGVIRSSFVGHCGGRQAFGAPDPKRLAAMVAEVIARAGVDAKTIGYVDAAANGSELGDPIEVVALTNAFARSTGAHGFCALGSVKSNIGHLEAASGVSQLSKVLLQMRHRTLVPTINSIPRNRNLRLDGTPFALQETLAPWPAPQSEDGRPVSRRSLIHSIGAGGAAAALLVEDYESADTFAPRATGPATAEHVFVLAAQNEASLFVHAAAVAKRISDEPRLDLTDLAYTSWRRRHELPCRAAIVARSIQELTAKLDRLVETKAAAENAGIFFANGAKGSGLPVDESSTEPAGAAHRWVCGGLVDGLEPYAGQGRRVVPLPTYAFDHRELPPGFQSPEVGAQAQDGYASPAVREALLRELLTRVSHGTLSRHKAQRLIETIEG